MKAVIQQRGLTIAAVARRIDVDRTHLYQVLNGNRTLSPKMRRQLASALLADPVDLFPEAYTGQSLTGQESVSA